MREVKSQFVDLLNRNRQNKVYLALNCVMEKPDMSTGEVVTAKPTFRSVVETIVDGSDVSEIYSVAVDKMMESMACFQILKFTEKPIIDESIQEYEYHEYEPQARTNLNSASEIVINIELRDLFSQPSESYLVFEGRLTKNDDTAYANADAVALTNNGIMYLFNNISYRLSNQEIESIHHPG